MSNDLPVIRGAAFKPEVFTREVVTTRFLGRSLMVVSRPSAVQHILVTNADAYVRPSAAIRVLAPAIGGGLFLAIGHEWRRQRKMLAPSFLPREIPRFARDVVHLTHRAIAEMSKQAPGEFDLFAAAQSLSLAVAAHTLLSIDTATYDAALRAMVVSYSRRLAQPGLLDFLLPASIPSLQDLPRRRFRSRWMRLVATIVDDRMRNPAATADLFDVLVRSGCNRTELEQQVATLLVTGGETTGAAIYWTLYLVASRPDVQARIAEEVASLDLEPGSAPDVVSSLIYTRAVVQEAMRLFPPAFSIVRQSTVADEAAGVPIPKGAVVQTAPFVLHRHEMLWDRPHAFDPTRFLPGAPPPGKFAYLPFGIGPRACIAAQFAQVEPVIVVAMLVRSFEITPTTDRPVSPVAQITLQPDNPAPFRLVPRSLRVDSTRATPVPASDPIPRISPILAAPDLNGRSTR